MGTLTHRVPNRVSSRPSGTQTALVKSGVDFDVAIAGMGFLLGDSKERPYVRKTAPYRKDQIDQTPIPGEQSMVYWWLRSQQSFHGGTGIIFEEPALEASILYADPNSATAIPLRYQDSEGVDVFTQPGHVTLLPGTTLGKSATGQVNVMGAVDGNGVDCWFQAEGTALARCVEGSNTAVTWGGAGTILSMTNDGTNYYVADNVGIWKGTLAGGVGSKAWNTANSSVVIRWVKDRLVAAIGPSIYELVGGAPPTLPTALYTAQNANYVWTAIEEGPDGVYLAGYIGNTGHIWYVGLTTGPGNTAVLSAPKQVYELPRGEVPYSLKEVMGSFLAIGTNKGVRIADFDNSGHIQTGPLFASLPSGASPVYSITSYDRYVIAAWGNGMADGTSGLLKVDLGFTTQFAHYAYAKDLRAHVSGAVRGVTQYGASGRLVFTVDGHGSYLQNTSAQALETSGYLQTGNIRYHTQEQKLYKYCRVLAATLTYGSIAVTMADDGGGVTSIMTLGSTTGTPEFALPSIGPKQWVNFTFTLNADTVSTNQGPTFYSYQIKALPAQKNQRMIVVPVLMFDHETDKSNGKVGYEGYARDRLQKLEAIEEARDNVIYQDFSRNPFEQRLVVIDDIQFEQTDPPTNATGTGGYAQITLRTVD